MANVCKIHRMWSCLRCERCLRCIQCLWFLCFLKYIYISIHIYIQINNAYKAPGWCTWFLYWEISCSFIFILLKLISFVQCFTASRSRFPKISWYLTEGLTGISANPGQTRRCSCDSSDWDWQRVQFRLSPYLFLQFVLTLTILVLNLKKSLFSSKFSFSDDKYSFIL